MIVLVVAVIFMGLLQYIIYGTKFGRAMRAVSFNFETASLMGIPTDRVPILDVRGRLLLGFRGRRPPKGLSRGARRGS